ncbi:hypothetical protein [Nitrospirillum viridazoti]|uniref:Uncharacterized protein n=1 Tax=Nitrospirillum viridazoti CBAmc TaxID=1441467 RepID=A0A248JPD6_9PROT|nr:hypothetical protein [Nitrospirillum amazonense]ASG20396.1 hypothetical protein Y958_05885 [Nitrospirillum amazonense CBAmc]TWB34789.1 hypothetical protein FBZ91_111121 [Nitrospirillum amazonense]
MPNRIALHEALDIMPAGGEPIEFSPMRNQAANVARPARQTASALPDPMAYVIEIDEEAVGLVTVHPEGMAFHAVHMRAQALDGQVFADAAAARAAAESAFYGRE